MSVKSGLFSPPPHDETLFPRIWINWFKDVFNAITQYRYKTGIPTTADIPPGFFVMYKDTSGGTLKIYANDGGTIKSVTLT